MAGIVQGPLTGLLQELLGAGTYAEWSVVARAGEAMLAPYLREVAAAHPRVYVKSHARRLPRTRGSLRVRLTLSLAAASSDEVAAGLEPALADLVARLEQAGIEVESISRGEET
jgi:uncharacterized heparinase superfamily protein